MVSCPAFEQFLAEHCAPTLLSQKCGSLISLSSRRFPDLSFLADYGPALSQRGISYRILWQSSERTLFFLYRSPKLLSVLRSPEAQAVLMQFGYPGPEASVLPGDSDPLKTPPGHGDALPAPSDPPDLTALLRHLERRLVFSDGSFPHEIGLFLGYPPKDVSSFIRCGGKNCRFCGYWKVYHDTEAAKRAFTHYDRCRKFLCLWLRLGNSIAELPLAA